MPRRLLLLSMLALLVGPPARAAEPAGDATPTPARAAEPAAMTDGAAPTATRSPWYALSDVTHLGMQLDAGAPGAGGATILFRPWWWMRVNAGLAYDYVGFGLRGGISFVPFHWAITPSLNLDYGHYLSGDATRFSSNAGPAERALLKEAVYDFASAQVGLEFGSQRWFAFYVRGGFSYVTATAKGALVTAYANEKMTDPNTRLTLGDASLRAVLPCASLGFLFYVY